MKACNLTKILLRYKIFQCAKSVQIQSFFWSVFSRIRTEYGEIFRISPYSVRMRKNTDQEKPRIWRHFTQCFPDNFVKFSETAIL